MQFYRPTVHRRNLSQLSAIQFPGTGPFSAAAVATTHGVRDVTDITFLLPNICAPSPQGGRLAMAASLGCAGPAAMSLMPATCLRLASLRGMALSGDKAVGGVGNAS